MRMIKITDPDSYKITTKVPDTDWSPEVKDQAQAVWRVMMRNPYMAGLAANQVDIPIRVMAIKRHGMILNPELTAWSEDQNNLTRWEGCYSIPGVHALVRRPARVMIKGIDVVTGKHISWPLMEHLSWVALHELDHLDGILMTDKAVDTKDAGYMIEMIP